MFDDHFAHVTFARRRDDLEYASFVKKLIEVDLARSKLR